MRLLTLFSFLSILAALGGCSVKPLDPAHAEYAGHWAGAGTTLDIGKDAMINYEKVEMSGTVTHNTSINAPIQEFVANGFTVGVGPVTTTFVVQAPPHKDGDVWKMTVDGVELTRS